MNTEHIDMYAGDSRTLTLHGRDASNLPVSLTGKTVAWYVGRAPMYPDDPTALLTKSGTVTVAASGTFTVALSGADTANMAGDYEHMAKATGAGAVSVIVGGRFRVHPVLSPP